MSSKKPMRPRRFRKQKSLVGELKGYDYDYRKTDVLKKFLTETGRILPRRRTSLSARQQRHLAQVIKRARVMALLPYTKRLVRK